MSMSWKEHSFPTVSPAINKYVHNKLIHIHIYYIHIYTQTAWPTWLEPTGPDLPWSLFHCNCDRVSTIHSALSVMTSVTSAVSETREAPVYCLPANSSDRIDLPLASSVLFISARVKLCCVTGDTRVAKSRDQFRRKWKSTSLAFVHRALHYRTASAAAAVVVVVDQLGDAPAVLLA